VLLALIGLVVSVGLWAWVWRGLPSIDALPAGLALPSTRIYDRHGRLLYEILPPTSGGRNRPLALAGIPAHCIEAVIATEDATFYDHSGVSLRGVARALWLNLRGGDVVAGGSTITQQVARNLLLDPHARQARTLQRKLREMALAWQIEARYSKDEILALWLNQTDFGNVAYGIDAAANAVFGKPANALSLAECALLAGLPQSPSSYNPLTAPDAAKARQATVLRLMREAGYISVEQEQDATRDALQYAASSYPMLAPHFVLMVWEQLEADYPEALYTRGLEVITTLDLDWQQAAETIIPRELAALNHPPPNTHPPANAHGAALVALNPHNGEVLAWVGSPDYTDSAISGALNMAWVRRQPGSALKPFTYALAFDPARPDAWNPNTALLDVRTPFITRRLESYVPANYDLEEHGWVTVRTALGSSYNIPAVLALEQVGIDAFVGLMGNLGVVSLAENPDLDLAVTLGGGEVRLIELTAAYGALANGGERVRPQLIQQVTAADGERLYAALNPPAQRVMDERVAFLVTDILADDSARFPSFGRNSRLNIGRPAAAKTGTTTDLRDNWVVGYTPDLVVGVWVGNPDYTPMVGVTGLSGAAPIWHHAIRAFSADLPETAFAVPSGVEQQPVCAVAGLPDGTPCPQTRLDWFISGVTSPKLAGAQTVRWLSPDPYTVYRVAPRIPREHQRVQVAVSVPAETQQVRYAINGVPLATLDSAPFSAWWQLEAGSYTLTAEVVLADGSVIALAPAPITVIE